MRRCMLGCSQAHGIAFPAGCTSSRSPGACRAALQAEPNRHNAVEPEEQVSSAHGFSVWTNAHSVLHGMLDKWLDLKMLLLHALPSLSVRAGPCLIFKNFCEDVACENTCICLQMIDIPDLEATEDITRQVPVTLGPH